MKIVQHSKGILIIIFILLFTSISISKSKSNDNQSAIKACREAFPEVALNPAAPGGWRLFEMMDHDVLCIYGEQPVTARYWAALGEMELKSSLIVVARSQGGPVGPWLEVAERLSRRNITLVVDEACFSSCAIYLPIISRRIHVGENSLLIWHGGPTTNVSNLHHFGVQSITIDTILYYLNIGQRTELLYENSGISVDILTDSMRPTDRSHLNTTLQVAGIPEEQPSIIAGYAYNPQTLESCFGFNNLTDYWHPGDDSEVLAFGQRRSKVLLVLESPKDSEGVPLCSSPSDDD